MAAAAGFGVRELMDKLRDVHSDVRCDIGPKSLKHQGRTPKLNHRSPGNRRTGNRVNVSNGSSQSARKNTASVSAELIANSCMSSEHFGQLAWQFERMSGSSGLKVQAAIAC